MLAGVVGRMEIIRPRRNADAELKGTIGDLLWARALMPPLPRALFRCDGGAIRAEHSSFVIGFAELKREIPSCRARSLSAA
jgi:hypothetical protein